MQRPCRTHRADDRTTTLPCIAPLQDSALTPPKYRQCQDRKIRWAEQVRQGGDIHAHLPSRGLVQADDFYRFHWQWLSTAASLHRKSVCSPTRTSDSGSYSSGLSADSSASTGGSKCTTLYKHLAAIGSTLHQKQSTAQSQYGKKGTGHQSRQFRHVYPQDTDGHHRASSTNSIQCARAAARGRDMGGLHVQ